MLKTFMIDQALSLGRYVSQINDEIQNNGYKTRHHRRKKPSDEYIHQSSAAHGIDAFNDPNA